MNSRRRRAHRDDRSPFWTGFLLGELATIAACALGIFVLHVIP